MRRNKNEVLRLKNMIPEDEVKTENNFNRLLVGDTLKVLRDYMDVKELPVVEIKRDNDCFFVNIFIKASAIKNFSFIQDEEKRILT